MKMQLKIPSLPEKKHTQLFERIALHQWWSLGGGGMVLWLFTFGTESNRQPWHAIGGWMFLCSLGTIIGMSIWVHIYESYRVVSSESVGYYWMLNDDGRVVSAKPGRYWFDEKDSLFVLYQTTRLGAQFGVRLGDSLLMHSFDWTLTFTGEITRETAVAFVNWYSQLPFHRKDHEGMRTYLQQSEERTDLPFQVVLPRPAIAI